MQQEINVPSTLNDLTLEQYQAFIRLFNPDEDDIFTASKMISVFCKIRLSDVLRIKKTSVDELAEHFTNMFEADKPLVPRFKLNDTEFGFITNVEEMSLDEYADLDSYMGDWSNMHKAMAVMYRPITNTKGDKYTIEEYLGSANYSEVMKYAPLNVAMGAMLFFYRLSNELQQTTLNYLAAEIPKITSQVNNNSMPNGDGTLHSMHLLKATLQDLNKSENYLLPNVSLGWYLKKKNRKLNNED